MISLKFFSDIEMEKKETYGSTLSLMERINKALGKDNIHQSEANPAKVPRLTLDSCSGSKSRNTETEVETESDNDSDFDDNVSLLECARMSMLSSSKQTAASTNNKLATASSSLQAANSSKQEIEAKFNSCLMEGLTNLKSSGGHSSSQSSDNIEKKYLKTSSTHTNRNLISTNEIAASLNSSNDSVDFNVLNSKKSKNNTILTDSAQIGKYFQEEILPSRLSEEDLPALDFSGSSTQANGGAKNEVRAKSKIDRDKAREEKQRAKDAEKLAKLQEKQRKLEEKESKKKSLEFEKASKKAASMNLKAESVDQCLKYVTVVLDSNLLKDAGGPILQSLDTLGVQYEIKQLPVEATVGWMRDHVEFAVQDNCQIKRVSNYRQENQILMRLQAEEFAKMIQKQDCATSQGSYAETIFERINNAEQLLPDKKITILVTGMNNYMKTMKAKSTLKKKQPGFAKITQLDIEEVLLRLQLQLNYCVHFCETSEELAQMVASFTKAVAEKPFKKIAGTAFNIYMNNHDKGLPRVTKDGQGLLEVWSKQLQQFKGVGHDTAAAIVQQYPSPLMLMQAYDKCSTEKEARLLIQDIEVRRGHGVLATSRRVGPELSRKVHQLLTSVDGDTELAK